MFNIPERITSAIMVKCSNMKGKVLSPDIFLSYDFGTIFICHCG